jgi:hypothetical protein
LNAPVGCKLSGLKYSALFRVPPGHGTSGVRSATPCKRLRATSMSSKLIMVSFSS